MFNTVYELSIHVFYQDANASIPQQILDSQITWSPREAWPLIVDSLHLCTADPKSGMLSTKQNAAKALWSTDKSILTAVSQYISRESCALREDYRANEKQIEFHLANSVT